MYLCHYVVYDDSGFLSEEQTSPTMKMMQEPSKVQATQARWIKWVIAALSSMAVVILACLLWMAVISAEVMWTKPEGTPAPLEGTGLDYEHLGEKVKALETKVNILESRLSQSIPTTTQTTTTVTVTEKDPVEEKQPSFAALRTGGIYKGDVTYNKTLHSVPEDSFSTSEGAFTAPKSGTYFFSFSGTSFCSENWVAASVNGVSAASYYDRDSGWVGPSGTAHAYFRGWTQQFALQLEVGDVVKLTVDCDSSEASWTSHEPGTSKEHDGHICFYGKGNFYFFGQFMG